MTIVNRRNALLGWLAWTATKRIARRKARQAVPAIDPETKRPNKGAIASALALGGTGVWLAWKLRSGGSGAGDLGE